MLRFDDPAIVEASGLVVDDGLFVTTNDSGDTGRVFVVDRRGRDGRGDPLVGRRRPTSRRWRRPGPAHVWVGDIGDNLAERSVVTITRVPVGRGDRTVQRDVVPAGLPRRRPRRGDPGARPADRPALRRQQGRLRRHAVRRPAPPEPDRVNPLTPVGRVLPMATDGAFFPDGRHLVVRSYASATVYAGRRCRRWGRSRCQRSARARGSRSRRDGVLYLSSEGVRQPVLRLPLAVGLRRIVEAERQGSATFGRPRYGASAAAVG